jgi:FtsH-binding integral membrane protein
LENTMKKIALAAALSLAATASFAGGLSEPVMEAPVVEAATSSSSGGILVPLLLLLVIAAAASN